MKKAMFLSLALVIFAAGAVSPNGWKWRSVEPARASDVPAECSAAAAEEAAADEESGESAEAGDEPAGDEGGSEPGEEGAEGAEDPDGWSWNADDPDGWSWNGEAPDGWSWNGEAPDGWSWNSATVLSVGDGVTLLDENGATVTVDAPGGTAPSAGDEVLVITTGSDTLLAFPKRNGGLKWTTLGWSWNS